jgi:hypothetical protein
VRPIDVFAKIYDLPPVVRNRLLTLGIPRVIPIAAGLKIRVDELDDAHACTTMPLTRRGRSHIGTMYIGAMLVQAEATMATLVISKCRPPAFRVLVKRNEGQFHAKGAGPLRALCRPDVEERFAIEGLRLLVDEQGEAWTTVELADARHGERVATFRFLISASHRSPRPGWTGRMCDALQRGK